MHAAPHCNVEAGGENPSGIFLLIVVATLIAIFGRFLNVRTVTIE